MCCTCMGKECLKVAKEEIANLREELALLNAKWQDDRDGLKNSNLCVRSQICFKPRLRQLSVLEIMKKGADLKYGTIPDL